MLDGPARLNGGAAMNLNEFLSSIARLADTSFILGKLECGPEFLTLDEMGRIDTEIFSLLFPR